MPSKKTTREYPVQTIRETLRQRSVRQAAQLSRSVGRLTSCDVMPCPEYREEVASEYAVIDRLLYIQQCRSTLEACIASGAACLCYRWSSGVTTKTHFRRITPSRVRITGLLEEAA